MRQQRWRWWWQWRWCAIISHHYMMEAKTIYMDKVGEYVDFSKLFSGAIVCRARVRRWRVGFTGNEMKTGPFTGSSRYTEPNFRQWTNLKSSSQWVQERPDDQSSEYIWLVVHHLPGLVDFHNQPVCPRFPPFILLLTEKGLLQHVSSTGYRAVLWCRWQSHRILEAPFLVPTPSMCVFSVV